MEHLPNDHEDCCNQFKNGHKWCDEMGHPVVTLLENKWKIQCLLKNGISYSAIWKSVITVSSAKRSGTSIWCNDFSIWLSLE